MAHTSPGQKTGGGGLDQEVGLRLAAQKHSSTSEKSPGWEGPTLEALWKDGSVRRDSCRWGWENSKNHLAGPEDGGFSAAWLESSGERPVSGAPHPEHEKHSFTSDLRAYSQPEPSSSSELEAQPKAKLPGESWSQDSNGGWLESKAQVSTVEPKDLSHTARGSEGI